VDSFSAPLGHGITPRATTHQPGSNGRRGRLRVDETRNRLRSRGRGGDRPRRARLEGFRLIADGGRFSAHGTPSGSFALIDSAEAERQDVAVTTIADLQYGEGDRSRLLATILAEVDTWRVAPSWARPSY
jgi:hypothetical protein